MTFRNFFLHASIYKSHTILLNLHRGELNLHDRGLYFKQKPNLGDTDRPHAGSDKEMHKSFLCDNITLLTNLVLRCTNVFGLLWIIHGILGGGYSIT